jgi:hypothetical protein
MKNISTFEVTHYTRYEETLIKNLKSKSFYTKYTLEFCHLSDIQERKVLIPPIPMTCFCDIPFDLSNSHRNIYRNFGLTMTESWKLKNQLNPISYLQFNSKLSNVYCKIINTFQSILESSSNKNVIRELANLLRHQSYFLKQYKNDKGFIDYAGKIRKLQKSKFYDEREWKYIPFDAEEVDELFYL